MQYNHLHIFYRFIFILIFKFYFTFSCIYLIYYLFLKNIGSVLFNCFDYFLHFFIDAKETRSLVQLITALI